MDTCIRKSADPELSSGDDVSKATDDDHDNIKLRKELADRKRFNLLSLPSVTINENVLRSGTIDSENVLSSICSMLKPSERPEQCTYAIAPMGCSDSSREGGRQVSFSFLVRGLGTKEWGDR